MTINRRDFIKTQAIATAAATAGISVPALAAKEAEPAGNATAVRWDKAACRFCGTGCSVLVGVQNGRVVATQGDPDSQVNRGLNCIKGYFLSKIMYGADRVKTPMLRMKDGKYSKDGEFTPISWNQAFDIMAEKWKAALKAEGPGSIAMFGSGQWTIWEGYAANKLFKAGFRSNNLDPNARHCMASAVTGFMRTFGIDEPMGCYDDIEQADAFVLWGSNMAEMHPILWTRITDRRLTKTDTQVHVLSTFEHRSFELADNGMIFVPNTDLAILNYICNYIIQNNAVNQDFVKKHVTFMKGVTDIGYGLRPTNPLQQKAKNPDSGDSTPMSFDDFAKFVADYDLESVSKLSGVPKDRLQKLAELYAAAGVDLAALALGCSMTVAVEFSFLLGFVTLSAATALELAQNGSEMMDHFGILNPIIGIVVAGVAAFASVRWMITYLERHPLTIFGWYRIALGLGVGVLLVTQTI
mgnify:CR=1 FL=1